jgi:SAM-dependent methyltransferase
MPVDASPPVDVAPDPWEAAYLRFETPDQEERKFLRRLRAAGATGWNKSSLILDLFCGRGGGTRALHALGFRRVVGFDLSLRLLRARRHSSECAVADCRALPVGGLQADVVVVQGGLHHLPRLPEDLAIVLDEVARALRPGGLLVVVEPWLTPFLSMVHWVSERHLARRLWGKLDALATMIEHERDTYEAWLHSGPIVLSELDKRFERRQVRMRFGKVLYAGTVRRT